MSESDDVTLRISVVVSFVLLAVVFVVAVGCGDLRQECGAAGRAVEPSPPPLSGAGGAVAGSTVAPPTPLLPTDGPTVNAVPTPSTEQDGVGAAGHDDSLERP